jgi:hypothetical protein
MQNASAQNSSLAWQQASRVAPEKEWSRLASWMAGSAATMLTTLDVLWTLAPLNYVEPQPAFFGCVALLFLFWLGWCTLLLSLSCWVARKLFR